MTTSQAERITGYQIKQLNTAPRFAYAAHDAAANLVAEAVDYTPTGALKRLVEKIYKIHGAMVMAKQEYKCGGCHRIRPLEIHHKIHRSKGRNDKVENLIALCLDCHRKAHGARQ